MKYMSYIVAILMLGCGPKENQPIFVNVSGLSITSANLPEGMDLLSFGSVSIKYVLEWNEGGSLAAGRLEDVQLQPDEASVGGVKGVGTQRIWEDDSSCRCDETRPKGRPTLSKPTIKLCDPKHLSFNGSEFEGATPSSCLQVEATDYEAKPLGSDVTSDIALDFTDAFTEADASGLCFKNESTSVCLQTFKARVQTFN